MTETLRSARIYLDDEPLPDCSFGELKLGDVFQIIEPDDGKLGSGLPAYEGQVFRVTAPPVQVDGLWHVPSIKLTDYVIEQPE